MTKVGIIMVGVPGCGKSTQVKQLIEMYKDVGVRVFSLDTCRIDFLMSTPGMVSDLDTDADIYKMAFERCNSNQKQFDAFVDAAWKKAREADVVIVDNTNLTRKSRARWIQDLRSDHRQMVGIEILVPLNVALERQATRGDKSVPESVVRDMYLRQQSLLVGSEIDTLHVVDGTGTFRYKSIYF